MSEANFANGFNCFCAHCGTFFNVTAEPDDMAVSVCPFCGNDELFFEIDDLLDYCGSGGIDPINFYKAFPPDEPIPNSRTGATPRQVSLIIYLVTQRKDIPLTAESIAGNCETTIEIVKRVFEELHITEKGGDK